MVVEEELLSSLIESVMVLLDIAHQIIKGIRIVVEEVKNCDCDEELYDKLYREPSLIFCFERDNQL